KRPLVAHLPAALERRLRRWSDRPWRPSTTRQWVIFMLSVIVGGLSHLFWDGFTHETGWFVQQSAALQSRVRIGTHELLVCHVLQHVSTLVGLVTVAWALGFWTRRLEPAETSTAMPPAKKARFWAMIALCAAGVGAAGFCLTGPAGLQRSVTALVVSCSSGAMIGLIAVSVAARRWLEA